MKKNLVFCLLSTIIVFSVSSCSSGEMKTQAENYSTEVYLDGDSAKGIFKIDMSIELPVKYKNKKTLSNIKHHLLAILFGEEYIDVPEDTILELFAIELGIDYVNNNTVAARQLSDESSYKFDAHFSYKGETLPSNKNIYSYCLTQNSFDGGVHEFSNKFLFNFSLIDGALITENDIFVNGFEKELTKLIKIRLAEEYEELFKNNLNESEFWEDEIHPNGNFYLDQTSIDYAFDPSEIAPHYVGDIYVSLPIESIKHLIKKNKLTEIYFEKN
jgi:hypothetical protein